MWPNWNPHTIQQFHSGLYTREKWTEIDESAHNHQQTCVRMSTAALFIKRELSHVTTTDWLHCDTFTHGVPYTQQQEHRDRDYMQQCGWITQTSYWAKEVRHKSVHCMKYKSRQNSPMLLEVRVLAISGGGRGSDKVISWSVRDVLFPHVGATYLAMFSL